MSIVINMYVTVIVSNKLSLFTCVCDEDTRDASEEAVQDP